MTNKPPDDIPTPDRHYKIIMKEVNERPEVPDSEHMSTLTEIVYFIKNRHPDGSTTRVDFQNIPISKALVVLVEGIVTTLETCVKQEEISPTEAVINALSIGKHIYERVVGTLKEVMCASCENPCEDQDILADLDIPDHLKNRIHKPTNNKLN